MKQFSLLYAEDDTSTRENLVYVLKNYFKNIYEAKNGEEALHLYKEHKVDIVLLDINMPKKNGLEVAREIRLSDTQIPIIIMTAYTDKEILLEAVKLKLEDYIVKPIDLGSAMNLIQKLLKNLNTMQKVSIQDRLTYFKDSKELFFKEILIELTSQESKLLHLFAQDFQRFFTKEEIYEYIWDDAVEDINYEKVRKLVSRFHSKINAVTNDKLTLIENRYSQGYKFKL